MSGIRVAFMVLLLGGLAGCQSITERKIDQLPPSAAQAVISERGWVALSYFDAIAGSRVADLLASDRYPQSPSEMSKLQTLQVLASHGDNYGTLVSGYVVPPVTGVYRFFVSGDDETQFWFSDSESQSGLSLIASVPSYSGKEEYGKYSSQTSGDLQLTAGSYHYFELRHKEGSGSDHFSVAWEGPGMSRSVIGASFLASPGSINSLYPDDNASKRGFLLGYRIGYFDGAQGVKPDATYPPLDSDKDGLYDRWEAFYGLSTSQASTDQDTDRDLLTAQDEFLIGTNPTVENSDGDGIPDGAEYAFQLDPLDPLDAGLDSDGDGASNLKEYLAGTDPSNSADFPPLVASQVAGLTGQYFSGAQFDAFVLTRVDPNINFDWSGDAPAIGMPKDVFTIRWFGSMVIPASLTGGAYHFEAKRDDGIKIYLDDALVMDAWTGSVSSLYKSSSFQLEPGTTHSIRIEFREGYGSARLNLSLVNNSNNIGTDPNNLFYTPDPQTNVSPDTDGDGMVDAWEFNNGLDPFINDANQVYNTQGVTNIEAYKTGLSPWTLKDVGVWAGSNTTAPPSTTDSSSTVSQATSVTLSWIAPSTRVDGSKIELSEIDHYEISYGQDITSLNELVNADASATKYVFDNLSQGTWYFEIRVVDNTGLKSPPSEPVSFVIK